MSRLYPKGTPPEKIPAMTQGVSWAEWERSLKPKDWVEGPGGDEWLQRRKEAERAAAERRRREAEEAGQK